MKILHLSDLHFKNQDILQDVVLNSLLKKIKELFNNENKPNILIITGDIAYSGQKLEYLKAKEFINEIIKTCEIKFGNVFIIPGNHDVDRNTIENKHIRWWYEFTNEVQISENLNSNEFYTKIIEKTQNYSEFAKEYLNGNINTGKYGQFVCELQIDDEIEKTKVKIVGLNSTLFCGYDGDENGKLALGIEQVSFCDNFLKTDEEIIISCVHHPFICFHPSDRPTLNVLNRFSDIILSGHVHEANNNANRDGSAGETYFITAGSSFEKREVENGFNIIELDLKTLIGNVLIYKYLPRTHEWIVNKDINPKTDGLFSFKINKSNLLPPQLTIPSIANSKTERYFATFDLNFNELNREIVGEIQEYIKALSGDINVSIIKMERGSVKIYFETNKEIIEKLKDGFNRVFGLEVLEIKKENSDFKIGLADKSIYPWKTFISPEFIKIIHNPGATFTHSRVNDLSLKDLFVSPNLRIISLVDTTDNTNKIINADEALIKKVGESIKIVVYGADTSGKSTLTKWWYKKYYEQGYIPVLISGNSLKDITIDKIKKHIKHEFNKQYSSIFENKFDDFDLDRIIVIIDDFHKIRFSDSKFKVNLISNLNKAYQNLFLTCSDLMQFETYTSKTGIARNILEDFNKYQIAEFGPKLRYELIRKWNGLGIEQLEPNELIRLNNETERHVETIIGKNFVPSYPVYLLTILQAKEINTPQKPEFSLHGFYYELLINEALNRAVKHKSDISLFYNFITDYSYFLFVNNIRFEPLYINDFLKFYLHYCEDYKIKINPNYILETLTNSKLLCISNDNVSISFKYVYYFFVARYLAINISNEQIRIQIKSLCERVHRDEFASIIMFLTHLSKDQFVLNQLLENSKELFNEYKPIKLEEDVSFINEMIRKLPEQVYIPIDVEKAKDEELKEEEELSIQEKEFDSKRDIHDYDLNEDISTLDALSKMIKAIKTIEIVGQVTKKYWGELKAPQKFALAEETYMLGLRTLGFYYSLIEKDNEMLIEYLKQIYRKKHINKNISKEEVDKASRSFLFGLCVMSSYGIIKRVTNAIGYEKLAGTFEDILTAHNYTSVKLIDTSIKLDYNKSFPYDDIKLLKKNTDKHFLSDIVMKNLVINYLYVFKTTIEEKQKICAITGIKLDQHRMIDADSSVKKGNK